MSRGISKAQCLYVSILAMVIWTRIITVSALQSRCSISSHETIQKYWRFHAECSVEVCVLRLPLSDLQPSYSVHMCGLPMCETAQMTCLLLRSPKAFSSHHPSAVTMGSLECEISVCGSCLAQGIASEVVLERPESCISDRLCYPAFSFRTMAIHHSDLECKCTFSVLDDTQVSACVCTQAHVHVQAGDVESTVWPSQAHSNVR